MIDEKKIIQATNDELKSVQVDYMDDDGFGVLYPTEQRDMDSLIRDVFADGVYWAISQFKKSLWHDAQEMPKKDKPFFFVQECNGRVGYHVGTMFRSEDYTKNRDFWHMTKWCYIDDILPKKGGEE